MKVNLFLKISIIIFIILHGSILSIWSIWGERLHKLSNQPLNIIASYVAYTGTEQYWDLFASEPYDDYQAIIVCDTIQFPKTNQDVECAGKVLYKSYDGDLAAAFKQTRGNQSRSYRFAEQFSALNNETAYESFLRYWDKHTPTSTTQFLYLIAQYQPVEVNETDAKVSNQLIWAIKRS